jgi:hypothetical protein
MRRTLFWLVVACACVPKPSGAADKVVPLASPADVEKVIT